MRGKEQLKELGKEVGEKAMAESRKAESGAAKEAVKASGEKITGPGQVPQAPHPTQGSEP